ncbi:glycosyltransferase [Rhodobacterales bacterium HKCCE2091]|nr:glycosyltransferase [Rhodobacterales bacterium HKCCE2091]
MLILAAPLNQQASTPWGNADLGGSVAVIIAARDAEGTIGAAVSSALSAPEVGEVIVVDDGSLDATGAASVAAAGGDPRLRVIRSDTSRGPAAARNRAIAESTAPQIAILDADDAVLPGRFAHLLSLADWDLAADNIVFLPEDRFDDATGDWHGPDAVRRLGLTDFVAGNLSRPGAQRGELGFLKPVLRREFLDRHGLRYDTGLRLGEDYDLYVRALLAGARFAVSHRVGYLARVRPGSLSGRHGTADLAALRMATAAHLAAVRRTDPARPVLRRQHRDITRRHLLRACLDAKAAGGYAAALRFALLPPANFAPIAQGVAADKMAAHATPRPPDPNGRVLLQPGS